MWCPKCKTEYTDGITVCADCGTELIQKPETADFINICEISEEKTADEILEFLSYSKVDGAVKEQMEEERGFRILVPKKFLRKAEKMVHSYLLGKEDEKSQETSEPGEENDPGTESGEEEERIDQEEELEKNPLLIEEVDEDSGDLLYASEKKEYVKKADRYTDMKFSGITFILFGILGGVYLLLTKLKVLPITYNIFVFCVIAALFVGFLISGIVSFVKANQIKKLIPEEEEKIKEIKAWLAENVTTEVLEKWMDEKASPSENDLLLLARIKVLLMKQFSEEDSSFLEMLADEYYEETVLV